MDELNGRFSSEIDAFQKKLKIEEEQVDKANSKIDGVKGCDPSQV